MGLQVAIPSSSGQSFQPDPSPNCGEARQVAIPSSSGQSFQPERGTKMLFNDDVAIPSSSGQSFQLKKQQGDTEKMISRNPFFIRSIVPTKITGVNKALEICRNPFFIRSIVPTIVPRVGTIETPASQSLLHQVNRSNISLFMG